MMPRVRVALTGLILVLCVVADASSQMYRRAPREGSVSDLAAYALEARGQLVRGIHSRIEAEARQAHVREMMLRLLGKLPERTPLNDRILGETILPGLRIQKVLFESQPGFPVPALLYLPDRGLSDARMPAIVMAPGHYPAGKAEDAVYALAFARNGFAVLSYDPIGQGERLQYPDTRDPAQSLVGGPTAEHAMASLQPVLLHESVAKYFLWDGMRAVDYLESRAEIDPARIGAFGCSGGGAMTALLGALDTRIAAVGTACYITTFGALLGSVGPQEAEQTTPGWIAAGLDFADYVEAAAPRPYAIVATESDMFPFAGTKAVEAEARGFYKAFDVERNLAFITAPGRHAELLPMLPRVLKFFIDSLSPAPFAPIYNEQSSLMQPPADAFQVTPSGQVSSSYPGSETVFSLNLKRAGELPRGHPKTFADLQQAVREVTGASWRDVAGASNDGRQLATSLVEPSHCGSPIAEPWRSNAFPGAVVAEPVETPAYTRWTATVPRTGRSVMLWIPRGTTPCLLTLVALDTYQANLRLAERLASSGHLVVSVFANAPGPDQAKWAAVGQTYIATLRAVLVNKTLLGERMDQLSDAVEYLTQMALPRLPGVVAYASGHMGLVLLHDAVLDQRLSQVRLDAPPLSYAELLAKPIPRAVAEDILPGVLLRYDVPDLIVGLGSRLSFANAAP